MKPGPPPFSLAHAATAAFLTACGTVVGGVFAFGLNFGKVNPCETRQFLYAALASGLGPVVVVDLLLARLDDVPQDASPTEIAPNAIAEAARRTLLDRADRTFKMDNRVFTAPLYFPTLLFTSECIDG